jgi:hypothetical protein
MRKGELRRARFCMPSSSAIGDGVIQPQLASSFIIALDFLVAVTMLSSNLAKTENLMKELFSFMRHTVLARLLKTVPHHNSKVTSRITARRKRDIEISTGSRSLQ